MKVFVIVAVVLAVIVVIGLVTGQLGPGGPHGPGRHLGGGTQAPAPTQGTPADPGAPAEEGQASRTVEISARDAMAFEPASLTVSPGETVTFVVTNDGDAVHDFTLGDAAMQQQHAQAMAHIPEGVDHGFPNSIRLQPGETKRLTWRFGDAGSLEYGCHQPGHYTAGMRGRITVA